MAFDNTNFRQCSFNYNNGNTDDSGVAITEATKDIGNGSETCIKIDLTKVNTVFKENVSVTQQIEVFFQPVTMNDGTTDILGTYPVDQRQGLFRLPQVTADNSIVYIAEQSGDDSIYYAYISVAKVTGLQKTTKPDGSTLDNYSGTATTLIFPAPTTSSEYTIKRLTHSVTDFVTYQPGGQLTSNLLNFQKGQEMFLIQELLWTIEMDMVTFTDLSGKGSIVTTGSDGNIPVDQINLSIHELNDVDNTTGAARVVIYKNSPSENFGERSVNNLLNVEDIIDVNITTTPANNDVLAYQTATGKWVTNSVSAIADGCSAKLAATLNFCSGANTSINIDDIIIAGNTFDSTRSTKLMTESGLTEVPLVTLKNVSESGIANGYLLKYQSSDSSYVPVDPATLGIAGDAGGDTFKFSFDTGTAVGSIGTGELRLNNATFASVTEVFTDTVSSTSVTLADWYSSFNPSNNDTGDTPATTTDLIKIFKKDAPQNFLLLKVTGLATDGSSHTLTVTHILSNGSFSDADNVFMTHVPSGLVGLKGSKGDVGDQGPQGEPGADAPTIDSAAVAPSNANQDLTFTWTRSDASTFDAVLSNWNAIVDTALYYVISSTVTGYGKYNYVLNTASDGSGTAKSTTTNAAEIEDTTGGIGIDTDRTFQGIVYGTPQAVMPAGEDEKVYGVNKVSNDLYKLLPIPAGTRVLLKTTDNVFCVQNVIELKACGS